MWLPQIALSGIATGAIYSLIAVGFTVVFNATKVTNFAHGEFVMIGGLASAFLVSALQWPVAAAVVGALLLVILLAVLLDYLALQHASRKTVLDLTMITIGVGFLYRGLSQVMFGREIILPPRFGGVPNLNLFDLRVDSQSVWILLCLVLSISLLSYLFLITRLGKAMRAASQNPRAAALCGIDPRKMSMLAFGLGGATGALAGALVAPIGAAYYEYGLTFGLKGFAAAVLGGFGNPVGAVLGGMLIGLAESFAAGYLSSAYKDATSLAILLGLLLVRPNGLLGRAEARRV
jgi:branched-chain amino acid transport system permease protein